MKSRRHVGSWIPKMGLCLVAGLLLLVGLAPGGILGADEGPLVQEAPMRPVTLAPHPPGTGYNPPEVDLSHLTGQALPRGAQLGVLPAAFDWRTSGKVTPVKNQGNCGSCYAFGYLGSFESRLLIDGAGTWDLSENHAKECNWKELNNYQNPPGTYWGSCDGGNSWMITNLYSQTGSVLEACNPYVASDVTCSTSCPYQQSVLDFRLISGSSVPSTEVLKQYIYDHGPVATSMYVDEGQGFNSSYNGSWTFNYSAPSGETNHGVVIVGWSNNLPPVPGSSTPADGWIVKNSWGATWGASGYFYMTYGAGNIGYNSAFVYDWQSYDSGGDLWYYDEDGWVSSYGYTGSTTAWGLAKYIPDSNTNVTRVEFWSTDTTTDVDVYLYDSFDGSSTSTLLASKMNSSFAEAGYHSVALDSPVPVTSGNDVIAVVKFTNSSYGYPVAADKHGPIETGRTYISLTGGSGSWSDLSSASADATIRVRTSAGAAPAPTVTSITPSSGQNTGTVHITNLAGSNFQSGATVKLTRSGQSDINATSVVVVNSSQITCDFNLAGAATGAWNVVVTNPDMQSGTLANGFTVTGATPAPTVTSITPNSGQNTGTVHITNLAGSSFQSGATVKLTKSGQSDINATSVVVVNSSQIACDFNLAGVATGAWNVVVTNPDMQSGTLANGFTVTSVGGEDYYVYLPLVMRRWPPVPYQPTLNPISNPDGDGNYTVSWSIADLATGYQLQEDDNPAFSSPSVVYSGSGTSTPISGKALGTYYYRVRGCNTYGCGSWSQTRSVVVSPPSGPNPGFWEDSTTEFYVTSDRAYVDDFAIYVYVPGCGNYKITHTPLEPIVSNHFSFSGSFYGNGTFASSTSCSGTKGLSSFYIPGCGYVSGGPFSYTATWQGAAQAAPDARAVSTVVEQVDEDAVQSFMMVEVDRQ